MMPTVEELKNLEKHPILNRADCELIASAEKEGTLYEILENAGRYYYRLSQDGKETSCTEVTVRWKATTRKWFFAYTPDDRHIYDVNSGDPSNVFVFDLRPDQVKCGDTVTYSRLTLEYLDPDHLRLNGYHDVEVKDGPGYVYKFLPDGSLQASGGAAGLYIFLEHIAEEQKAGKYPLFRDAWALIFNKLGVCCDAN